MAKEYDLVIIGTGTAAMVAAARCRAAGWQVAMIDELPFGGTCALRGCDPKKVLVGVAAAVDQARRLSGKGVTTPTIALDWSQAMAFKRSFTASVPPRVEGDLARRGIATYHGAARFVDQRAVVVGGERIEGRFVLVAAGAAPIPLGIPGAEHTLTSDRFLELDALPRRIVFIGGGYIAAELSHLAARAGAEATVVQRGERLLPGFDPELVELLMDRSRRLGIDVRVKTAVEAIERAAQGFRVATVSAGARAWLDADLVVHAAGRAPDLDALDLAQAGIERDRRRLKLNDYLQSVSNPAVYAAGDAAARGPMLTPIAGYDGDIVAANLLEGNHRTPDYAVVPSAVFTVPPLAMVGLTEAAARERGLRYRVSFERTSDWHSARRVGEDAAGFKVVIERDTQRILGAHLLGPHADEVINVYAVAMRAGMRAPDLKGMLFAYPTSGSDIPYMLSTTKG